MAHAAEDMIVARLLMPHGLYNAVAFHCQQAAEKWLKALLVAQGVAPRKTHELDHLVDACRAAGLVLPESMDEAAFVLTPFASISRYPGWGQVEPAQAATAIALAERIGMAVREALGA